MGSLKTYEGGCHCGRVRFSVEAPDAVEVERCNCSICRKAGFLHLIVPATRFRLLSGSDSLTTYTFNTGVAEHYFCKVCGVKPFYKPRSNPDGIDVNLNCLERLPEEVTIVDFDGQNWEDNAAALAHKSRE
ncbi:MAG: GFA family protein [Halieaceae bacterium]|nr:GFA family protein [Halieaceae bacterium]